MDDAFAKLEADYCPPLDPALFSAIISDYDLTNATNIQDARDILDQLKESALLEEAAGFDPSGTGAYGDGGSLDERTESRPATSETDATSLSNGISSLGLHSVANAGARTNDVEELETLDEDMKIRTLQDLFGDRVTKYSIQHTLKKCNGRWQAAMEELLNHVYFDEAEHSDDSGRIAAKGIDAFSEDNTERRGRKAKAKGRRQKAALGGRASSLPDSSADGSPVPSSNRWQAAGEDIDFIASRMRLGNATVSSVYYAKGASIPRTIAALLKETMEESKVLVTDNAAVAANARDLGYDFPGVAPDYLAAIIRLTHPSTSTAHELATALTLKPKISGGGGIQIVPHYATPSTSDTESQSASKRVRASGVPISNGSSTAHASAYASAATAFAQASAAHRRARSDRLMGGAAAYYGEVGREHAARSSNASAAAADNLAASQSSATQLDLHGIDVRNGTRIAQERVEGWWYGLGESRVNGRIGADDRQSGYTIIVGLGRHSEGGKGKLGPAVSKVLRQAGWNFELTGAAIVVRGRAKK